VALIGLTVTAGCVRFGYDPDRARSEAKPDASRDDAGMVGGDAGKDGAADGDGAIDHDATLGQMDANVPDAGGSDAMTSDDTGSPNEAGMDDAGPTDSGQDGDDDDEEKEPDAGRSPTCLERDDALFCDGFEDADFAKWDYTAIENGTVTRSTDRVRTGEASLRATTGASGQTNYARYGARVFDHQKSGDIWLRYYYFVPSSTTVTTMFSSGLVGEIEPPYFGFSLAIRPDRTDIAVADTMYRSSTPFPRGQWTCVELHVKIDASSGYFEAYFDEELAIKSPNTDTLPDMGYTNVDLGIHYTDPGQGPVVVFVDDVVAGNHRVGCD